MTVAIVTGASRGLGAGISRALAADGHAIAVNYAHDDEGAARVVRAIGDLGGRARAFRFDVTDEMATKQGVAAIVAELGAVDIVVNNAIGAHGSRSIEEQSWDDYLTQLRFCVKAPLQLLQSVIADWKSRKAGCLINIGSEVTDLGNPEASHYVSAKAAMIGLTRSWARELGPFGIRVNLISPGFIPVERHSAEVTETLERYRREVPLAHLGVPADVGAMVSFLASPRAGFITGQTFAVNGGRTLA